MCLCTRVCTCVVCVCIASFSVSFSLSRFPTQRERLWTHFHSVVFLRRLTSPYRPPFFTSKETNPSACFLDSASLLCGLALLLVLLSSPRPLLLLHLPVSSLPLLAASPCWAGRESGGSDWRRRISGGGMNERPYSGGGGGGAGGAEKGKTAARFDFVPMTSHISDVDSEAEQVNQQICI